LTVDAEKNSIVLKFGYTVL